jgi:hypothetical protein
MRRQGAQKHRQRTTDARRDQREPEPRRAIQIMTTLLIAATVIIAAIVIGSLQHINPKP